MSERPKKDDGGKHIHPPIPFVLSDYELIRDAAKAMRVPIKQFVRNAAIERAVEIKKEWEREKRKEAGE